MSISLTGGERAGGHAKYNTKTDSYRVSGANNKIVTPGGGNLDVVGQTTDTGTTVDIGGVTTPAANQFQDKITIALNGSSNTIASVSSAFPSGGAPLNDATIDVTVAGSGGSNVVNLDNNGNGHTSIDLGGDGDAVTLNGDAQNSVTLGGGHASVRIGTAGDNDLGFVSTVGLSDNGSTVTGGDENITVTGGIARNTVTLGNGNDSVTLSGARNLVTVGDGRNSIELSGGSNTVTVGDGSNVISATGNDETITVNSGHTPSAVPGSDSVLLGGAGDRVAESYGGAGPPANVSVFGSTGSATVTLGNGNDTVVANGDHNTIVVGSGNDTVSVNGASSTVTLNGNASSVDSTVIGDDDSVAASNGLQQVSAMSGDTISLSDTRMGSAITFGGSGSAAMILDDGSVKATFDAQGAGNSLIIDADSIGGYTGHAVIDGLAPGDGSLSFGGLAGLATAQQAFQAFLGGVVAGGYEISTPGGGTVTLHTTHGLSLSMFG